jgi:L-asparaginase / beta-aspartyl-peptidase
MTIGFALHGGAFTDRLVDGGAIGAHMALVAQGSVEALRHGAEALDVVTEAVTALEDSGLYLAGKGSAPNSAGAFDLDASIMDGATRLGGGVAGLSGIRNPVRAARLVMEKTPHVLLIGAGARSLALQHGLEAIDDPESWYTPAALVDMNLPHGLGLGTVGAVALDDRGNLAAATSTGGTLGKRAGRVGDTPLIGAGTWADAHVAVSCTGQGEFFIRAAVAADIAARIRYGHEPLESAAIAALADMARLGGFGGLIALDRTGAVARPFNTLGLKCAWLERDGTIQKGLH